MEAGIFILFAAVAFFFIVYLVRKNEKLKIEYNFMLIDYSLTRALLCRYLGTMESKNQQVSDLARKVCALKNPHYLDTYGKDVS